ncbi:MAG: glutathione S-transferase family protein [Pseudomonadota bacterium]
MKDYIHHGLMFSYYSAKTRAYLSYKRLPFVEQYVAADLSGRIRQTTNKVMIPVLETPDGEILQDTTVIIDALEARHPERPVFPADPVLMLVTRLVEFTIDELWVSTAMNTRWNDPVSREFASAEFSRGIGGSMGLTGDRMMAIGQRVAGQMQSYLPQLGIDNSAGRAAADHFFRVATEALNPLVGRGRFALGNRPSLIDFCLFTAYYAHQYRDLGAAQTYLKSETPDLCYYLDELHASCCTPATGELSISAGLVEYLKIIGPASAGFARGVMAGTTELAASTAPGSVLEQRIAPFDFELAGQPFRRGAGTFGAWKLQRVFDVYDALDTADSQRARDLLGEFGWADLIVTPPAYRLERRQHMTHLA